MTDFQRIEHHYAPGGLIDGIRQGLGRLGLTSETVTPEALAPVEEFHIGGRAATQAFLDSLALGPGDHVLDIGCGIGGASRFAALTYGCRVSGVDLTREFVDAGNEINAWLGLSDKVGLTQGNVLSLRHKDAQFDKAFMMHVGMNIADKVALFREVQRVLKPGGIFGIYDIMQTEPGELAFPMPWAGAPDSSAVVPPAQYVRDLGAAGFEVGAELSRRDFALEFFERIAAAAAAADGPPPLGLHLLMGAQAPDKLRNMIGCVRAGLIAPVELMARKV